jgi:hypothetical protein
VSRSSVSTAVASARDLAALLLEQRLKRDAGHQRERQDRHRGQQQETAAQRNRVHRQAPISRRCRVGAPGREFGKRSAPSHSDGFA